VRGQRREPVTCPFTLARRLHHSFTKSLRMTNLVICREYPPALFPPGGIGTYVVQMSKLLAEAGETVHVIAERWAGAYERRTELCDGRLVIHRVSMDEAVPSPRDSGNRNGIILEGLAKSDCPSQAFSWQAALLAEQLIETESIDLIEAQEWEAPLYYFQLRRALGLGPKKQPPCVVHLHSPSELIFQHNEWDQKLADFVVLKELEKYSVNAADALLCPSEYLARGSRELFGLGGRSIAVIPYPLGDTPVLERSPDVWARDTFCFAGRLELRKGVVEWVQAAVRVAASHPSAVFVFIGSDTSFDGAGGSVREHLEGMIPGSVRRQFQFQGSMGHGELLAKLSAVSVAVVPSRWENFPYTCIEAMASGLPVLASPNGGMSELITDGQNGWLAESTTAAGFQEALIRVIETPPARKSVMGSNAENTVRTICGNASIVKRHLEFRRRVAGHSRRISATAISEDQPSVRRGIGYVVKCFDDPDQLGKCLASIRQQSETAPRVVVVTRQDYLRECETAARNYGVGCEVISAETRTAAQLLLSANASLLGVALLTERVRLEPHCGRSWELALRTQTQAGILSSWHMYQDGPHAPQAQISAGIDLQHLVEYAVVRAEMLTSGTLGDHHNHLTYPDVLLSVVGTRPHDPASRNRRHSSMARAQYEARNPMERFMAAPFTQKVDWVRRGFKQPRRAVQWVAWQLRNAGSKALSPQ